MMKTIKTTIFTLTAMLVPSLAFAQDAPAVPEADVSAFVEMMITAAKGGEWSLFVAALIMVLVFLATKVKFIDNLLPAAAKPWVAAVAGMLTAVATTVITTGNWLTAALAGFTTGAAAAGLWSLIGKKILNRKSAE
jgi:uncharacterized membrane protein